MLLLLLLFGNSKKWDMTNNAFQYQLAAAFTAMQCRNHAGASEAIYESGDPWRPRDREPITGIWEQSPSGVQGQSPWLRVFLAFGRPTEVAKFAVWIVSDKRSICDVCIKLNRIPYTPSVSGKSKAAGRGRPTCWWRWERGSKNSTILLINGAFWWHG